MEKHSLKCASKKYKYSGDRRNEPYGDEKLPCDCDGYHTFDELYEHRIVLWIKLCEEIIGRGEVWCSIRHSDGTSFDNWFILGIGERKGEQITYHLPNKYWDYVCRFATVLDRAPEFDGHTSDEVLNRIKLL